MLSRKQKAYMNVARFLAAKSSMRHKHGAVVVKSGRVVGMGYNKSRNHPDVVTDGKHREQCGYHAEAVAIKEAGTNARGATIFVARINRQGEDLLSKPCELCQKTIEESGLKNVLFTRSDP
jgi:pyrimidine deaminase RibD-like protein